MASRQPQKRKDGHGRDLRERKQLAAPAQGGFSQPTNLVRPGAQSRRWVESRPPRVVWRDLGGAVDIGDRHHGAEADAKSENDPDGRDPANAIEPGFPPSLPASELERPREMRELSKNGPGQSSEPGDEDCRRDEVDEQR